LWAVKHAPKGLEDFAGNPGAREEAAKWALDWKRGKKGKPLLLHGPPGSGKTTLAKCVASNAGWGIVDLDESILDGEERLKALFSSSPLYSENNLVLIDAAESRFKQGEISKLAALAAQSSQPVAFTVEDVWDRKLAGLRNACIQIALKRVNWLTVRKVLTQIAEKEGAAAKVDAIAQASHGDLCAAINDLQAGAASDRNLTMDAFEAVKETLKKGYAEAVAAENDFEGGWEMLVRWLQENVPREYDAEETAKAFDWLSRGDVFAGRIRRRQDYGMLRYVAALSAGGVASAKKAQHKEFVPYAFPSIIRALSASRESRAVLKSLATKAGRKLHVSRGEAVAMMPFLALPSAAEYFALDEKEAELLVEFGVLEGGDGEKRKHHKPKV